MKRKPKFNNGRLVLKEIKKVSSKYGTPVTRWAAAKWLSITNEKQRLLKERREIDKALQRLK